jgi:hypothetical protein
VFRGTFALGSRHQFGGQADCNLNGVSHVRTPK